jgi:hypothetical protein
VAGAPVTVLLPPGWTADAAGDRLSLHGPGGAIVTVSAAPRRGRSLAQLGGDTRAALRPRGPAPLQPVSLGGRRALRVTARGREVTALVVGPQRWVVSRDVAAAGSAPVAQSVRIG